MDSGPTWGFTYNAPSTLATGPSNSIQYTPWGAVSSLLNGCKGSGCTPLQETYFYNKRMQMAVAELGTSSTHWADTCRVYNYYVGVQNISACSSSAAESPSNWPSGTNNNGDVAGYYYNDNITTGLKHAAVYAYDHANRLSSASATGNSTYSQTFSYDRYGNMDCSASPAETKCIAPTYSATTNRITTTGYSYDAAGNLLGDGAYTYQWDAEERLTGVYLSGSAVSTHTYNALGQRVRDVTASGTTDEAYGADGALLWRYTGNSNDTNQRAFVPFGGRILAEYYNLGTLFDHADELGSLSTASDYATGNFAERLFYPFGEPWTGADLSGLHMHQTFALLPDYDPETDQYNTPNRHYNPTGRWLSPDPAGLKAVRLDDPQTWNMYAYVRNNPTTLTDPSGLVTPDPVGGGDPTALVYTGTIDPLVKNGTTNSPPVASQPAAGEKAQNQVTPQSLRDQIPGDVRANLAGMIKDSNSPTADDKTGGFHEEYAVAGLNASGGWVVSRDKPGPYANPDTADHVSPSGKPANQQVANSIVDPRVAAHVHPSGTTARGGYWVQRPSAADKAAALPGQINIVFGARENRVYFYNSSGVIGKPMKLKDFLGQ